MGTLMCTLGTEPALTERAPRSVLCPRWLQSVSRRAQEPASPLLPTAWSENTNARLPSDAGPTPAACEPEDFLVSPLYLLFPCSVELIWRTRLEIAKSLSSGFPQIPLVFNVQSLALRCLAIFIGDYEVCGKTRSHPTSSTRAVSSINGQNRKWPTWDFKETRFWHQQGRRQSQRRRLIFDSFLLSPQLCKTSPLFKSFWTCV